jgi:uncharacterized protein involved in exopolysaccharide biosynthesis
MTDSEQKDSGKEATESVWLDRLIVVAANIRLLVLGPALASAIAYGVCFVVPQSYVSLAIVALPAQPLSSSTQSTNASTLPIPQSPTQAAAIMVSPLVLDPILRSLNPEDGLVLEHARKKLADKIKASAGKDLLLRLEVTGPSPEQAQKVANAVIDGWLKTTVPGERERVDLEKRLEHMKSSLAMVTKLLEKVSEEGVTALNKPLTRGESSTGLVGVGELQTKYLTEVLAIPRALQGFSRDVVAQPPTLPIEAVWPKKWLVALLAGLLALLLLLAWVFGMQGWRKLSGKPGTAEKIIDLRRSLLSGGRAS